MKNVTAVFVLMIVLLATNDSTMCVAEVKEQEETRPNIVWIMAEDISTELGCYGHPAVNTPNLDGLASQGMLYKQAFCTAPSCTPSRNAMMTGVYQTRTGTQDQRRRGVQLPANIRPITHLLRDAGYFNVVGCGYNGKTDLNFEASPLFDGKDWRERKEGQPFFAQITLGVTHRHPRVGWSKVREQSTTPVDPSKVELPPYFPDHPSCRLDWAMYLDSIEKMDRQVGDIMARLKKEGLLKNTIVIFIGDNGRCHLRGKCWLYDPGLHVPLIIKWPGRIAPGKVNSNLVSMIDVSATVLEMAKLEIPEWMDGRPLFGQQAQERKCIFASRDLIDEVMDPMRCVRTNRFKYIRNYRPENGYQECKYVEDNRPMLPVIRKLAKEGRLTPVQKLLLSKQKPAEELYDLESDPHELRNLANSTLHQNELANLRKLLDDWIAETGDKGLDHLPPWRPSSDN